MALSCVIRKTLPTMAFRGISSGRVVPKSHTLIHQELFHVSTSPANPPFYVVRAVDEKLVESLNSEIKSIESRIPIVPPADFPFSIEEYDNKSIQLKMADPWERIKVVVQQPKLITKEDEDNKSSSSLVGVPLQVKIFKLNDTTNIMTMKIVCCVDDQIIIEHMDITVREETYTLSHPSQKFKELGADLQNSIIEYIGVRGINKANVEFLLKYMAQGPNLYHISQVPLYQNQIRFLEYFNKFVTHDKH